MACIVSIDLVEDTFCIVQMDVFSKSKYCIVQVDLFSRRIVFKWVLFSRGHGEFISDVLVQVQVPLLGRIRVCS